MVDQSPFFAPIRSGRRRVVEGLGTGLLAMGAGCLGSGPEPDEAADTDEEPAEDTILPDIEPRKANRIEYEAGRVLPTVPEIEGSLTVLDARGLTTAQRQLATTLQGIVNRHQPRLHILQDPADEGHWTWLETFDYPFEEASLEEVIEEFRDELTGAVVPDEHVSATTNVATTMAGLTGGVLATESAVERFDLEVLADLRGRFDSNLEAYQWAQEELGEATSDRVLVAIPDSSQNLRDYAVATEAFVVWLDLGSGEQAELFETVLDGLTSNAVYLGWFPEGFEGEIDGVERCSRSSTMVGPSDWFNNMTVHAGVEAEWEPQDRQPVASPESAIYVTFTYLEGDNLQFNQHAMRANWDDDARGEAPINWSISPLLLDAAPGMFGYYVSSATANDRLIAGPSGLGYMHPTPWPEDTLEEYTATAGAYMADGGLEEIYLLNREQGSDIELDSHSLERYGSDIELGGIFLNFWGDRPVEIQEPTDQVITATGPWASDADGLVQAVRRNVPRDWDGDRPLFLSIAMMAFDDVYPSDVRDAIETLEDEDERPYEFILADEFFGLASQA